MNTENGCFEDPNFNENEEDYYDENYPFADFDLIELIHIDVTKNLGIDKKGNWYIIKLILDDEIEVPYQEEDELEISKDATLERIKEEVEMEAEYLDPDINSYFIVGQTSLKIEKNLSSGIFTVIEIQRINFFQAKLSPIPDEVAIVKGSEITNDTTDQELNEYIDRQLKINQFQENIESSIYQLRKRGSSGPKLQTLGWLE
ncbi:MAG: hypothetical protein V1692_02565 [bacterium]